MSTVRQALVVSYAFPPVGGAGVQRTVKFVKYLGQYHWQPTVLTVLNPSVPVFDHDLVQDIPEATRILRARTLEPNYRLKRNLIQSPGTRPSRWKRILRGFVTRWLQPDPQVLWNRNAYRTACDALRLSQFSAIYVSGPPFSSFLLGCKLKMRFGLPLILDFRDEWSISSKYLENSSQLARVQKLQMRMFESSLHRADVIVATTMASARELTQCCQRVGSSAQVHCIYNGFDPDDLRHLNPRSTQKDFFRLVYTGTLWKLTDIEPFVSAVQKLAENSPTDAARLEIHFVGRRTEEQEAILDRLSITPVQLRRHDYLPHRQSLQVASDADALLLTLADLPGAQRVVPGKLFEYLSLKRPILSIVPDGEAQTLLSDIPLATNIQPTKMDAIEAWLSSAVQSKFKLGSLPEPALYPSNLDWCNRSNLAGQLAIVFNDAIRSYKTKKRTLLADRH